MTTTETNRKPLRDFVQVDGWANFGPGDSVMVSDDDGDVVMGGPRREPQNSDTTVRIMIAAGADRDDVVRIIRKQLAWIEQDGGIFPWVDAPLDWLIP